MPKEEGMSGRQFPLMDQICHMAQRTYVEVAGFTHVGHMLVECKMPV